MSVDLEDAVVDIVAFLKSADWTTIIAAINTEKGDFSLDTIGKFYFGQRTLDQILQVDTPVLVVEPQVVAERDQEPLFSHEDKFIEVSIFAREDITTDKATYSVEEKLLRKCMRYERALRTLMRENPALGQRGSGYIKNLTFAGSRYTGVSSKGNVVFRAVVVRLKIFAIESWT